MPTNPTSYISYYRVSTQKQGQSGLGLDAQRHAVESFVKDAPILAEFVEIESGKKNDRPELTRAIAEAKRTKSVLVIAKLDRLSRNAAFIFTLRDSGVEFVCADMPDANTLTIGIFAVLAQHERELISQRTKAALAAKKAQGFRLGTPANFTNEGRAKGRATQHMQHRASSQIAHAHEIIHLLRSQGYSYRAIVQRLDTLNAQTHRGKSFSVSHVWRVARKQGNERSSHEHSLPM
jgi:DNA invertase Pin-like site-specific DNA recombinase